MTWEDLTVKVCVPANWDKYMNFTPFNLGKMSSASARATTAPTFTTCQSSGGYDYVSGWVDALNNPHTSATTFYFDTVNPDTSITQHIPAVGDMGDYLAVLIWNSSQKTYKPQATRVGQAVTSAPVIDCNPANTVTGTYKYSLAFGTSGWAKQSWASTWDIASIDSWTAPTTWPTTAPTWDKIGTGNCGSAWTDADGCAGITTWAFGSDTAPSTSA